LWSAIAGAVAAGAIVFAGHRILGGLALGGAMFLVALQLTPCCADCAQGKATCGGGDVATPSSSSGSSPPFVDPMRSVQLFKPPTGDSGVDVIDLMNQSAAVRTAGKCS